MAWVKIDDKFSNHPKLITVGPLGKALYVDGLCYVAQYLTDGFIPGLVADQLALPLAEYCHHEGSTEHQDDVVHWLINQGLWEEVDGGYQVHDYLDYNPSKAQVLAERDAAKERMNRRRSPEVRPNNNRRSPEVIEKFKDPVPVPRPLKKEMSSDISKESKPQQINATYEHTLNGHFDKVADRFARIDQQYTAGWLRSTLLYCEAQVGPLPLPQLGKGIELTIDQLQRAKADDKIRSPRAFARKVMVDYLTEQRDEHHAA